MVFSHHYIDISGEKRYGWGGGVVACRIIVSAPVQVPYLWDLNLGLDLGLTIIHAAGFHAEDRCRPGLFIKALIARVNITIITPTILSFQPFIFF